MNIERLKIWRDALVQANKIRRPFSISSWGMPPICGGTCCAGGDLALDPRAQELGMRATLGGAPGYGGFSGHQAIANFVGDDGEWSLSITEATNAFGFYRDSGGRALEAREITRDMVIAAIEAKIAELETQPA